MKIKNYPRNLEMLVNHFLSRYMEPSSKHILINRARQLRESIKRGIEKNGEWTFSIPPDKPLTFNKNDYNFQVDIFGKIEGVNEYITKQCFNLRIWSFDKDVSYREEIDAPEVKERLRCLGWKRVILRFHFDLKNLEGENLEPLFHLHVGGLQKDGENCWLNEKISVPRFSHPPMDLILLCEFVLMNFFLDEYRNLKDDNEWISLIRKSQELFQRCYFKKFMGYVNDENNTLLGNLISSKGVACDE